MKLLPAVFPLCLLAAFAPLRAERSASTSFSIPSQPTPPNEIQQPAGIGNNPFSSDKQEADRQQRAENAKIIDRLTVAELNGGGHDMMRKLDPDWKPLDLAPIIKANRLLTQGLKGPDDVVIGFIEITDGEVIRDLSLVLPVTAGSGSAAFGETVLSIAKLESTLERDGEQLSLNFKVDVYDPPQPGPKGTIHATAPDGTPLVIEATGGPVTPQSGINSSFTLQRDQAHSFGGLTSTHTSTDKDGNKTTSKSQRIFWFLW